MTNNSKNFGKPDVFEVSLRWLTDDEPARLRPMHHGWSMGELQIVVGGRNLTAHGVESQTQEGLIWYVGPLLHWLADNWKSLLNEEKYSWPEKSAGPAAEVCNGAIAMFSTSDVTQEKLGDVEAWYKRHGIANAACGGLFPDIFIRRFSDDAEISWTSSRPPFAPEGFYFKAAAGFARTAIGDVAKPLLQLLHWVREAPPVLELESFKKDWQTLVEKIDALDHISAEQFNSIVLTNGLLEKVQASFREKGREDLLTPKMSPDGTYVEAEAPAVAMFGGLSVDLSNSDVKALRDTLIAAASGMRSEPVLASLIENAPPQGKPWADGYALAESLLDDLEEQGWKVGDTDFVDVRALCGWLGVTISDKSLDTGSIRGVALAGDGLTSTIIINTASSYNLNNDGRRFTIAHELCHILYDQSRARRLAHTSGPWVAPGIEKRANAFAAWLLMPPRLLQKYMSLTGPIDASSLKRIADSMNVAERALIEHLYNLDVIGEYERDTLRRALPNERPS